MTNQVLAPRRGARRGRVLFLMIPLVVLGAFGNGALRASGNSASRTGLALASSLLADHAGARRAHADAAPTPVQPRTAQSSTGAAASASELPAGWSFASVGDASRTGVAVFSSGAFGVTGAGTGLGGRADQFSFVHRLMSGDFDAVVRVASLDEALDQANAGLSIRSSLNADASHVTLLATTESGVSVESRQADGVSSSRIGAGSASVPVWLKLERRDQVATAYTSTDGQRWTTIASASVSWPSSVYVGLTVTSEQTRRLAAASFTDAQVTTVGGVSTGGSVSQALATDAGGVQALVATSNLPSGWQAIDIGDPAIAGNVSYSNGVFTIDAAGRDVWDAADQFTYAYRQMTGDVEIVTRVTALENVDVWTKAGPMFRASLSAASAHVTLFTSTSNGIAFQHRPSTGAESVHASAGSGAAPVWLRLVKRGSTITASRSSNGTQWTTIGSRTQTLPTTFYVGLAVTSTKPSVAATATIRDVTVTGASAQGNPPTVSLTAPANGASVAAGASVTVTASASDSDGSIKQVEFFRGGTSLGVDTSSPYSVTWANVTAGSYSLTAVATDDDGNTTTSAARTITVTGAAANPAPTVSLSTTGTTFTAPGSIAMTATAADGDGIAKVEFWQGSTLLYTDTQSPYSWTWANVAAGSYSLTAVAYDARNASTRSTAVTVTVAAATTTRRVAFTPSTSHSTVQSYRLDIFTQGANPATATPVRTRDLGKPTVTNNEIIVTITDLITPLSAGNYFATVTAVAASGSTRSASSPVFAR